MAAMETTKYCKSCGLPLMPVYNYVSSGGTGALVPPAQESPAGMLTYRQQKVLAILAFVFAPAYLPLITAPISANLAGWLSGISAVLMPLGIVWASFYFNAKIQRHEPLPQGQPPRPLAAPPMYVPPPQTHAQPLPPHRTNPLAAPPRPVGSVVDDETRRLPDQPPAPSSSSER
jgi:hypothetical protein